ncbi:MAG TPA: PepSY domain-containing protein [Burkholderiales bacterium]
MTKRVLLVATLVAFSSGAGAAANCPKHPKKEWMPQAEAKAKIEAQGYKISKFKVDGNCYEIYGFDKDGKKAEVYFDTKTLAVVKAEIRK